MIQNTLNQRQQKTPSHSTAAKCRLKLPGWVKCIRDLESPSDTGASPLFTMRFYTRSTCVALCAWSRGWRCSSRLHPLIISTECCHPHPPLSSAPPAIISTHCILAVASHPREWHKGKGCPEEINHKISKKNTIHQEQGLMQVVSHAAINTMVNNYSFSWNQY